MAVPIQEQGNKPTEISAEVASFPIPDDREKIKKEIETLFAFPEKAVVRNFCKRT